MDGGEAYAAALAGLPGIGPAFLTAVLRQTDPRQVWERVLAGTLERPASRRRHIDGDLLNLRPEAVITRAKTPAQAWRSQPTWAQMAGRIDPETWWAPKASCGIRVTWAGQPTYPEALVCDPEPPGVIFWRGSIEVLRSQCVAIVGTRNATPDGRGVAFELGRDLARAGVCVVSGLALGIDGSAHEGALVSMTEQGAVGPVGVAASGVDVPYPRQHAKLWQRVIEAGAVLSETLPGRPAEAWRFPFRNRIIAGLARMVVVVESHVKGGSLLTAEAALERGVEVRVVPGSVHNPACAGSNQLLYDGPGPVRSARDVLDSLGIILPLAPEGATSTRRVRGRELSGGQLSFATSNPVHTSKKDPLDGAPMYHAHTPLDREAQMILKALGWRPASLNQVVERSGVTIAAAVRALDGLRARGLASTERGWWARTQPP
jgi:DNA processing protein